MTGWPARTVRVFLGVLLILVVLTTAILLIQPRLDLTPFRGTIAQYLSVAMDREVRVGGDLRLGLGRHVHLDVSELSVANPAWAASAELFRATEASAGIDLLAVLSGVIRLHGVVLRDAEAHMEVSADGAHSWDLGAPNMPDEVEAGWRLVIEDANAENVSLLYRNAPTARPMQLRIARLEQKNDAGMLLLDASATANELPIRLQGRIGPLQSLISGRDIEANLRGELPAGEINVELGIEQRDRPHVGLVVTARGLDLGRLLAAEPVPEDSPPDGPEAAAGSNAIADTPLSLGWLDAMDGRFRLTGEALSYPDPAFPDKALVRDLHLDADLAKGRLLLNALRLSGDRGVVEMKGALTRKPPGVTAEGSLQASGVRYGILAKGKALEQLPKHELEVQLTASGQTYHELAASLEGWALLTGGSGEVANEGIDTALGSFLGQLLTTINPPSKRDSTTKVVCSAAALQFSSGVVRLVPGFVTRTEELDIEAAGTIDLNTERIEVRFKTTPRKGFGLSAGGVVNRIAKVAGTLAEPDLVLDSEAALATGTAAAATGGLSFIFSSLIDTMSSATTNPCDQVVAAATPGAAKSPPDDPPAAPKETPKDVPRGAKNKGWELPGAEE
jgi:uncharacterized protein involved in outer membrane biogenesis